MKRFAPFVLAFTIAFGAQSCGAKVPPIQPLPAATESLEQDFNAFAARAVDTVKAANAIALDAAKIYVDEFRSKGAVPPAVATRIDAGFRSYTAKMDELLSDLEKGVVKTWPEFKAKADPILTDLQAIIDVVKNDSDSLWRRIGRGLLMAFGALAAAQGGGFAGL